VKYIPDNTLAHYAQMPQTSLIDLSAINCQVFGSNIAKYRNGLPSHLYGSYAPQGTKLVKPDDEAVQFYLFNHLAALIRNRFTLNEQLPEWATQAMREYKRILTAQGVRMVSYMGLITCRESRHLHNGGDSWWQEHIVEKYGLVQKEFHQTIHGVGSDSAANALMHSPPDCPVGNFFKAIETMFYKGSFSGGYGGKPWGDITKCLTEFLHGKISQEMMIDTAYTLAHNNGPMFNKGMLYSEYSGFFKHLLDVQRAGQIPELCLEKGKPYGYSWLTAAQLQILNNVQAAMPEEFGQYVDWFAVKKAGALVSCSVYQQAQIKKYGKKKAEAEKGLWSTPMEVVGTFAVGPGTTVPILKRVTVPA
jgi:hypothetical protein